jgi:O-antigen ligase
VIIGAVAAFAEIIQKASGSSAIYSVWLPRQLSHSSAPFVNRNHTAGWLAMAMSLAIGHLAGAWAQSEGSLRKGWRERLLWLSSREVSEVVLTAFAIIAMAIAIVFTESRSGFLCLLLLIAITGSWSLHQQSSRARKLVVIVYALFAVGAAAVMGRADAVGRRFASGSLESAIDRLAIWKDTVRIIGDFVWVGTGFNTYGIAMLNYQTVTDQYHYIEAHNDFLQLMAEGGFLLLVPAAIVAILLMREVRSRLRESHDNVHTQWLRAAAVAGVVVVAFQSIFDFTLQMPGAAVMFVMLLAIAIHRPGPRFTKAQQATPSA